MIYLADKLGFTMTVQQQKKMLHENICFIIDITGFSGHQSDECYIWHIVYLGIIFKCFACLNYLLAFVCNFYGISVLKKVGFVSLKSFWIFAPHVTHLVTSIVNTHIYRCITMCTCMYIFIVIHTYTLAFLDSNKMSKRPYQKDDIFSFC